MISFGNDYSQGAIPEIMARLAATNLESTVGYGEDDYCAKARETLKKKLNRPDADVYFLVGGTQTNLITIARALKPWQGVIALSTGHISIHESGAIEARGHKILDVGTSPDGKLSIPLIEKALRHLLPPHTVEPKMVYLSNPTEMGTLYTKKELVAISEFCKEKKYYLYLDGARMAMALSSEKNDIAITDYPALTDAFYLGGTKCGALFGEALVIVNPDLKEGIGHIIKQTGALFAKGRLLGLQFETLFENGLYESYGAHANKTAKKMKEGFLKNGIALGYDSDTNQQFPVFSKALIAKAEKKYVFELWEELDGERAIVRFVTSWATKEQDVDELIADLKAWTGEANT
ncbi:MAG: aminotransferase class I/II-fold pyridoxal phosphate-dependent enzyme [Fusobacteriaceae bacterium]|jgi:threonine aldolase|nr:aminotransferase class I/II-fold pyridoxal phosphate-dependent enzyme [Fusobacteriaceae bacterium]